MNSKKVLLIGLVTASLFLSTSTLSKEETWNELDCLERLQRAKIYQETITPEGFYYDPYIGVPVPLFKEVAFACDSDGS
jgi:hypothetical protein